MPPVFTHYNAYKKDIKQVAWLLILFVALQLVFSFLMGFIYRYIPMNLDAYEGLRLFILTLVSGLIVLLVGKNKLHIQWEEKQFEHSFSFITVFKTVSMMTGISIFFSIVLNLIQNILGISLMESSLGISNDPLYVLYSLLTAILVAPILEELIFRGVILQSLKKYDAKMAVILTGICFGLMHMNFFQGSMHMFTGIILAYVCVKQDSILLPILCHMFYNTLMSIGSYVSNTFITTAVTYLLIAMAIYGWVCIAKSLQNKKISFDGMYFKLACKQVSVILFLIAFVIVSVLSISF